MCIIQTGWQNGNSSRLIVCHFDLGKRLESTWSTSSQPDEDLPMYAVVRKNRKPPCKLLSYIYMYKSLYSLFSIGS